MHYDPIDNPRPSSPSRSRSLQELKTLALQMPIFTKPNSYEPDDVLALVQSYFQNCIKSERPPTMTGIAKQLGVTREDFLSAHHHDPTIQHIIQIAKHSIIEYVEEMLLTGKASINLIFWLKNNAGWIDKIETVSTNKTAADILKELESQGQIINQSNPLNNLDVIPQSDK